LENHLLEVNKLDVLYGDIQALYNVSIGVKEGDIVTLVGSNGSGKTTLLKTISGITKAKQGEIIFSGKSLARIKPQDIVNIGISHVPEGRGLFSNLTVLENLKLGAYTARARKSFAESLERAYELFPILRTRKNQRAGSLSGGEQQMLAITRSLMTHPDLLMLDEPSMGLSPMFVKTVFELITNLNQQGVTILLVEQNINMALKSAHYAYVIKTGKIVLEGKGTELLSEPEVQTAYIGKRWSKQ
jgi:branched-chain amino acid transport system ATP-binding protein